MTPEIIKSAWAKSGILLGDLKVVEPQIVLAQLPGGQEVLTSLAESPCPPPLTPERPIPTNKQFKTPGDLLALEKIIHLAKDSNLDDKKKEIIQGKIIKGAQKAFVKLRATVAINTRIIEGVQKKEEEKAKKIKGNYRKGRVLGQEEIDRLETLEEEKEEQKRLDNLQKQGKAFLASLSKFYTLVKREHNIYMLTDDIFSTERVPTTPFVSKALRGSLVKKQTATIEVALELAPTKLPIRQKKAIQRRVKKLAPVAIQPQLELSLVKTRTGRVAGQVRFT
jgi:hypothetical protein